MTSAVGPSNYVDMSGLTKDECVRVMKNREIDILVDLNGKTLSSGLDLFEVSNG